MAIFPVRFYMLLLGAFLFLATAASSSAADSAVTLTVNLPAAPLYSRQDEHSDVIAELTKGETLTAIAEAVGTATWYLVQTSQGQTGWVRGADVSVTEKAREAFRDPPKEDNTGGSVWTAQDEKGRTFRGTWTIERSLFPEKAAGTWTLDSGKGAPALRGIWSAQKFSTGWSGTWRAMVDGHKNEYTGGWTAEFPKSADPRMADLFEAAAQNVIRGLWSSGTISGSWSIRTAK
ncbi:MAG TPA: SH3 domain-containing protein [Candidatus Binatia bacterium]|jgi:uncharacterized protein YgiM (DUF1202 family)